MKKFSEMKFKKPNLKKIENDFNILISEFENATCFEEQDKALKKFNKYADHLSTNMSIGYVKYTCDTQSEENVKNQELLDEISPIISVYFNRFNHALVKAKYRKELEEKWGKHLFNMVQNSLETFDEKIVPELQEINKLSSEYTKLIASAKLENVNSLVKNVFALSKYQLQSARATLIPHTTNATRTRLQINGISPNIFIINPFLFSSPIRCCISTAPPHQNGP